MNTLYKPKSLPWLARRAGVPDHVADTLWKKALALAGAGNLRAADPRRQAEAMRYLLRMLGVGATEPVRIAANQSPACVAYCQ